jgi:hypothetical protein
MDLETSREVGYDFGGLLDTGHLARRLTRVIGDVEGTAWAVHSRVRVLVRVNRLRGWRI